jgi:hypothetical protein
MFATIQILFNLALLAIPVSFVGYIVYCIYTVPVSTPPMTRGQKLFYATKKSATLFVQFATASFLALGNGIMNFADFFGAPEVKDWVKQNLTPEVASGVIAVLLFLTIWARVRNLGVTAPPPYQGQVVSGYVPPPPSNEAPQAFASLVQPPEQGSIVPVGPPSGAVTVTPELPKGS